MHATHDIVDYGSQTPSSNGSQTPGRNVVDRMRNPSWHLLRGLVEERFLSEAAESERLEFNMPYLTISYVIRWELMVDIA